MRINERVYLVASGKMGFDWTHPSDCNVYLLDGGDELALVDTGTGESVDAILSHIRHYGFSVSRISHILLTHLHADHAGGAAKLREKTGAKVAVIENGKETLESGDEAAIDLVVARNAGFYPADYRFAPCKVDRSLRDGDRLNIGTLSVRVCFTPGHSRYDTSFFVEDGQGKVFLFCGDTVFFDGRISMLNTHDFHLQRLAASVAKLKREKVDVLLPGHFQPALQNGSQHIEKAHRIFANLGVPENIV
ncbi:MBL fold metallo-hydrolase [Bacillaceae bacterium]